MAKHAFRIAVALVVFTLAYNVFEGIVAIVSGLRADSIVLVAFGADSYVEVLAAGAVLWRLTYRDEEAGEAAEQKALRFIGATFVLLAAGIALTSLVSLLQGEGAEASTTGVLLLLASAVSMPAVAFGKLWAAARSDTAVLAAEAKESIACSYLTLTALAGVAAIALLGWWWLDAVAALALIPWLLKEGREALRGENCYDGDSPCFCAPCWFGLRACRTVCCAPACC
jgi:divalent metal cation (Fe/Co/Zn/Cd) transporter